MQYVLALVVAILAGIVVQLIRMYVLERDSPLPIAPRTRIRGAYTYLNGVWYEYHITRNVHRNLEPYWLRDTWNISVKHGHKVRGRLESPAPQESREYKLVGEIREGRMIITG